MDIHVAVTGARDVGVRFETFPDALYDALKAEISSLADELFQRVIAATPYRTGLLRSEERVRVYADKDRISGRVSVNGPASEAAKAGALEYGAHRPTSVRAHQMRLDHAWGDMLAEPMTVMVAAYTRTPNIPETAFERGPLAGMQPEILARLEAVVQNAAEEASA